MSQRWLGRTLAIAVLAASAAWLVAAPVRAAAEDAGRKVKSTVKPAYPELARNMHVTGSVKIEVTIAPNGTVTKTKVMGGHPLLVEAALDAIKKWKYEPAPGETTQVVQFDFKAQ